MKKIVVTLITLLNLGIVSGQDTGIKTFEDFTKQVNALEEQQKYNEAIELTQNVREQFPDRKFEIIKELEYLYGKTEQYEMNLALWQQGHEQGFFFLLHNRIKKFEPYLQFPQFDSLVQKDAELREAAQTKAKTIYQVVKPGNFNPEKKYPLLLILHGGGSNLEMVMKRWKLLPVFENDFLVAYFQSYRHYDSKTYGWVSSDSRAHDEVKNCFNEIIRDYLIDTTKVIIGGTSAGGTMAFDLAFTNVIPAHGIIAFCPGKPRDFNIENIKNQNIRIYMLGGENDYYLPKQQELAEIFDQTEIKYKHIVIPGMGHDFPENYEQAMEEALKYLMPGYH